MRIVFWGTSQFAVQSLEKLALSRHEIVLVLTQPDKRQGRHLILRSSPVKTKTEELKLKVAQPDEPDAEDFVDYLRSLSCDLFVVVSYGKILKKKILGIPRLYCINLHASLLPRYRGAAPINWAILNGEDETGITIIRMNEKMDAGDILTQEKLSILNEDTVISLAEKLSQSGADLLITTIELIENKKIKFIPQDETKATFAPLLKKEDGRVAWQSPAQDLHNQVRALQPWPTAFCFLKNRLIKLWKTKVLPADSTEEPGKIIDVTKKGIVVATGKGNLVIEELQVSGGKRMATEKFLLGHQLRVGERLD